MHALFLPAAIATAADALRAFALAVRLVAHEHGIRPVVPQQKIIYNALKVTVHLNDLLSNLNVNILI